MGKKGSGREKEKKGRREGKREEGKGKWKGRRETVKGKRVKGKG